MHPSSLYTRLSAKRSLYGFFFNVGVIHIKEMFGSTMLLFLLVDHTGVLKPDITEI